ncbi:MAG: O-antigen ligase family protein [Cyclobacteriaceae bacterium]|nr:O-antigen ligase family protein [Cyclobacteriaceae bacterium]
MQTDYSKLTLLSLSVFHALLSIALVSFEPFATLLGILPTPIILLLVILNRNQNNEAALGSAYIIGLEVIWRITGGFVTYEFAKYSVALILLTGKLVDRRIIYVEKRILIYVLSFFPAFYVGLTLLPPSEQFRQLSSIISGPICLVMAVIYFSHRRISYATLIKILQVIGFAIITLTLLLFLKTPNLESIEFRSQSNFQTSGGFGPNQVSSILGFGMVIMVILLWQKRRLTGFLYTDIALLILIAYRNLLTFSRGGMIGAIAGIILFIVFITITRKISKAGLVRLATFIIIGTISFNFIWDRLTNITEGQIVYRFTGRDTLGRVSQNITSGRIFVASDELVTFKDNILSGVGLSYSKFLRVERQSILTNTHNEITRTMAEQGLIGIIGFLSIFWIASKNYRHRSPFNKAIFWCLIGLFLVTISHSAMRLSMPSFIFGLALVHAAPSAKSLTRGEQFAHSTRLWPNNL